MDGRSERPAIPHLPTATLREQVLPTATLNQRGGRLRIYSSGTSNSATMLMILISGLIAGPAVSL